MTELQPINSDRKLVVARVIHIDDDAGNRKTFQVGEAFDNSLVTPRRLAQMYAHHDLVDEGTDLSNHMLGKGILRKPSWPDKKSGKGAKPGAKTKAGAGVAGAP